MAKEAMAVRWMETMPSQMICCSRRPLSKKLDTIPEEPSMELSGQVATQALPCVLANDCSRQAEEEEEEAKNENTEAASNYLNNFHFRRKPAVCGENGTPKFALLEWRQVFRALFAGVLISRGKILRRHPENKLPKNLDLLCVGSDRSCSTYDIGVHEAPAMEECWRSVWC